MHFFRHKRAEHLWSKQNISIRSLQTSSSNTINNDNCEFKTTLGWAAFRLDDFISEVNQSQLAVDPPTDVDDLFACYDSTISNITRHVGTSRRCQTVRERHVAMVRPRLPYHQVADSQTGKNIVHFVHGRH